MTRSNTFPAYVSSTGYADFGGTPGDGFSGAGSRFATAAADAIARFFGAIVGIAESVRRSHQIKCTYAELSALDNRTLVDIGVSRSELAAIAVHCVDNPSADYRKNGA